MQELTLLLNETYILLIIGGGFLLFALTWVLIDNIMDDRHLRDIYRILNKGDNALTQTEKVNMAMAYHRLGMRRFLKVINGVYDE